MNDNSSGDISERRCVCEGIDLNRLDPNEKNAETVGEANEMK